MVKEQVAELLQGALQRCVKDGLLPPGDYPVQLDAPRQAAHGDFASNAAMTFAKQHAAATFAPKPNPRALAQAIVDLLGDEALRRTLGQTAAEVVARKFGPDGVIDQLLAAYRTAAR